MPFSSDTKHVGRGVVATFVTFAFCNSSGECELLLHGSIANLALG